MESKMLVRLKIILLSVRLRVEYHNMLINMNYQTKLDEIMERYGIPIGVLEEASNLLIIDKTLKAFSDLTCINSRSDLLPVSITKLRNIGQGLGVRNTHSIPSKDLLIDDIMICYKKLFNCEKECIVKEDYQDNLVIGDPCDFDLSDDVGINIPELLDIYPVQVNKLSETKN